MSTFKKFLVYLPAFLAAFLFSCAGMITYDPPEKEEEIIVTEAQDATKVHQHKVVQEKVVHKAKETTAQDHAEHVIYKPGQKLQKRDIEDERLREELKDLEMTSKSGRIEGLLGVQPVSPDTEPKLAVQPVTVDDEPKKSTAHSPKYWMGELVRGNERFLQDKLTNFNLESVKLAAKQAAKATNRGIAHEDEGRAQVALLLPSHMQLNPELVFDQKQGAFFQIRSVSNVLGASQVASIEHAIRHQGVKLVVILDQEPKINLAIHKGESLDLDWVIEEQVEANRMPASDSNVKKSDDALVLKLKSRSRIIREAIERGELEVVRATYHTQNGGRVDFE